MGDAASEIRFFQKKQYLSKFIEKDVRPDSRSLGQTRPAAINLGPISSADGSAMVKLGDTIVICGIKAEITRPPPDRQDQGVIVPNMQLPPMCSPDFRPGAPSEEAQVISHYLKEALDECDVLDSRQLCIHEGFHCWILYCDVVCCNYDGNVRDAALLSLVSALKDLRLPSARYNRETEELTVDPTSTSHLDLKAFPVPLSFTIFDDRILLVDPTHEEESVCKGTITVITSGGDDINKLTKLGGASVSVKQLRVCVESAKARWSEVRRCVDAS